MEVVRDGDRKMLDVKIGAMPEEGEAVAASGGARNAAITAWVLKSLS